VACAEAAAAKVPVIVLKLDDITRAGAPKDGAISPRWQKCVDFIEKEGLRASFGIIGSSLEEDAPAYFAWIKNLHQKGFIEFWNHGYKSRKGEQDPAEFESASVEEQQAALEKTQKLAQEKLGIELKAFGPHWSGTNENTEKALENIPGIKIWFFGPAKSKISTKVMLERVVNLEQPTLVPNFEQLKERFEKFGRQKEYLVLQGHPNAWSDERYEAFVKAVTYLKAQGCTFMTVSELVASRAEKK
jgi:peptidoglycan/xylan/chitin deacetylase (PgdA/CDA1 family)